MTTTESVAEPVGKIQKRDPKRHSHPWCWLPGQACTKKAKKRHDDPQSIESQEVKETQNPWCWMPGQVCTKAKRQQVESEAAFWWSCKSFPKNIYTSSKVRNNEKKLSIEGLYCPPPPLFPNLSSLTLLLLLLENQIDPFLTLTIVDTYFSSNHPPFRDL